MDQSSTNFPCATAKRKFFRTAKVGGVLAAAILMLTAQESRAAKYYSLGTGSLAIKANWGLNTNGTGTHPTSFTGSDTFYVSNNNTTGILANWTVSNIDLGNGILPLNGNLLTLNQDILHSSANHFLSGSSNSSLVIGNANAGETFYMDSTANGSTLGSLTIANFATVDLGNQLNIAPEFGSGNGVVNMPANSDFRPHGFLTLKADANGSVGRIAGNTVPDGTVNIECYFQGQRGYRLFGIPFTSALDVATTLGTTIDVTFTGGVGNTGTCPSTVASTYKYTVSSTGGYSANAAPGVGTLPAISNSPSVGNGILAFVRGAKGEGCNVGNYTPSGATVTTSGQLIAPGAATFQAVNKGTWQMFVNPYASQISLSQITHISDYTAVKIILPGGQNNGGTGNNGTQYVDADIVNGVIPINGAFLVYNGSTTNNYVSVFPIAAQTSAAVNVATLKTTSVANQLQLSVYNGAKFWDNWSLNMIDGATAVAGDEGDVPKIANAQLDIYSLSADNAHLNKDARSAASIADGDIIALGLRSVPQSSYTLRVSNNTLPAGKTVYLHDKYTNTYTLMSNGASYPFSVNADAASQGENRMELVFNDNATTGVGTVANNSGISLVPNPAVSNITVNYSNEYAGTKNISIINVIGQAVKTITTANSAITIPVDNLTNGVYLIRTTVNGKTATQRFIKN